ncbi:protease SohB, partial [Klebsiella aerogenes]|nr:protease SohB [Klebsiella aerogenes]
HEVSGLREEITAVVASAEARDQGVVGLGNPGGGGHGLGPAASPPPRFRC